MRIHGTLVGTGMIETYLHFSIELVINYPFIGSLCTPLGPFLFPVRLFR
jgi:hypothetical protein